MTLKPIWCLCGCSVVVHTADGCTTCGRAVCPKFRRHPTPPRNVFYFTPDNSNDQLRFAMLTGLIGQIRTPTSKAPVNGGRVLWCADTGCFSERFWDEAKWWAWLSDAAELAEDCLFATVPDVWTDAAATMVRGRPWLERVRGLGLPAALVLQDGQEDVPVPWDELDAVFLGGTTAFKQGPVGRELINEALARDKHVHQGRVNSKKRLRWCEAHGVHTADGTYVAFGPDKNTRLLLGWIDQISAQQGLFGLEANR